jgi:hypothetical protein
MALDYVEWFYLIHNKDRCEALVNKVINFMFYQRWETVSFFRKKRWHVLLCTFIGDIRKHAKFDCSSLQILLWTAR